MARWPTATFPRLTYSHPFLARSVWNNGARLISIQDTTNKKNLLLLIQLRWVAVVGQVVTILVVQLVLGIDLPIPVMGFVVLCLIGLNVFDHFRLWLQPAVTKTEIFFELLLDVGALTVQIYLSGGAANPFISLYLLQVILGAVLLEAWATWTLVAITSAGFVFLTVFNRELPVPHHASAKFMNLHIQGMFICFVLAAILLVFFITRINRNLAARDAGLAELRQQSVEEEFVVRMGLLASGAAHELGTPLMTMSVILNDWQRIPALQENSDIAEDIEEMQGQVLRCKEIVSKVLVSSGEARGESAAPTTVSSFFDTMVAEWRERKMPLKVAYVNKFSPDRAIAPDVVLKQSLVNVLDNAAEASPQWVGITVSRDADDIVLVVEDRGPGFPESILATIGKPYQSTKKAPGSGLGLFLLTNVVRKLGGRVQAHNFPQGGAVVSVRLPIAALSVEASGAR